MDWWASASYLVVDTAYLLGVFLRVVGLGNALPGLDHRLARFQIVVLDDGYAGGFGGPEVRLLLGRGLVVLEE